MKTEREEEAEALSTQDARIDELDAQYLERRNQRDDRRPIQELVTVDQRARLKAHREKTHMSVREQICRAVELFLLTEATKR